MNKKLILNVDDLGLHPDIVAGVEQLWENRSISTVSILSTSEILDHTIYVLKKIGIPVGVHLILDGDRPVFEKEKIPSIVDEQGFLLKSSAEIKNE